MSHTSQTPRHYNGIAAQRKSILARLALGPATAVQLQSDCNAPDPRARIHELRGDGHAIETQWVDRKNTDCSVNRVALYVLTARDPRQTDLFEHQ
jgi:hypothetical protein